MWVLDFPHHECFKNLEITSRRRNILTFPISQYSHCWKLPCIFHPVYSRPNPLGLVALFPLGECFIHTQASYDFCLAPQQKNTFHYFGSNPLCLSSKQAKCPNNPLEERVLWTLITLKNLITLYLIIWSLGENISKNIFWSL